MKVVSIMKMDVNLTENIIEGSFQRAPPPGLLKLELWPKQLIDEFEHIQN